MTSIGIDSTCNGPVTINVKCSCEGQQPPAVRPLNEYDLHGLEVATVLPQYCFGQAGDRGSNLFGATAILPAGVRLASLGVGVSSAGQGEPTGESHLAIYIGGIAELAGKTAHKANLFTVAGLRWATLETPVEAAGQDRIVWLVAQVPDFTSIPGIAAAKGPGPASLVNGARLRSVMVRGATALPPIFDGDAVSFTPQPFVPMLVGSSTPIVQP